MAKSQISSNSRTAKVVGVGLVAGGLMLAAPAGMAFADSGSLGAVGSAVNTEIGSGQHFVNHNIGGLQGIAAINNNGLQAGVNSLNSGVLSGSTATSSVLGAGSSLGNFAVQSLLPGH
ncbi:MAG: hypothetical protein P4L86_24925 [Mycobacterium sp.]|nr:hypothetical protein [Mycobacterium sp.]